VTCNISTGLGKKIQLNIDLIVQVMTTLPKNTKIYCGSFTPSSLVDYSTPKT